MDEKQEAQSAGQRQSRKPKKTYQQLDPLDYILGVIGNPDAKDNRRDRLALAALPYCHARVGDRRVSKREQTAKAVAKAVRGDDASNGWGKLLRPHD